MNAPLPSPDLLLLKTIGPWYLAILVAMWAYNFTYLIALRYFSYRESMSAWEMFKNRLRDGNIYTYLYILSALWPFLLTFILIVKLPHQIKHFLPT